MKYNKIGHFELTRAYGSIATSIRFFFHFFLCKDNVLFNKLNHEERKNEPKKSFSYHVKGICFQVKVKTVNVKSKGFNVKGISVVGDKKANLVSRKSIIAILFTFIVNKKCTIVSKKAFIVKEKRIYAAKKLIPSITGRVY